MGTSDDKEQTLENRVLVVDGLDRDPRVAASADQLTRRAHL
jgi:hypothetical protein